MRTESEKQDLANELVEREVSCCVSSMVGTLGDLVRNANDSGLTWEEDILPLLERVDYEEAGLDALGTTDLDDLETYADSVAYWSDAIAQSGFDSDQEYADDKGETEQIDFSEWFEGHCDDSEKKTVLEALRNYIADHCDDWKEFCFQNDIDTDDFRSEVYEHWIVSSWLARKLKQHDEVVGELCGLTIWGRCTTGQGISCDYVIQQIAEELWPEGRQNETFLSRRIPRLVLQ